MMVPLSKFKIKDSIRGAYNTFRQDKLIFYSEISAFALVFAAFALFFLKASSLPFQVPLFYSLPWGEEQLASSAYLLILPISSFVFFIFNTFWAAIFSKSNIFLAKILTFSSVFISFLGLYALFRIIFLVS